MKRFFLIIGFCFLCASCQKQTTDAPAETIPRKTITLGADEKPTGENLPESIKVRVQISRREDLRVKVGDQLKTGDIIADRTTERNALEAQKRQAELALERLKKLMILKTENLQKPIMPDASFAEFEANIRRAQVLFEAAKRNIKLQESRIEEIKKLPFPGDMSKITQHETARLALLKGELLEAESNLALERAKLETAKANRSYAEQKDALEIQKAKITIGEQRVIIVSNITQLEAQITNLNASIIALSAVHAPFAGTVKKISWEGQTNDEITVIISVDVSDSDSRAK
jgi:hypothetical protein